MADYEGFEGQTSDSEQLPDNPAFGKTGNSEGNAADSVFIEEASSDAHNVSDASEADSCAVVGASNQNEDASADSDSDGHLAAVHAQVEDDKASSSAGSAEPAETATPNQDDERADANSSDKDGGGARGGSKRPIYVALGVVAAIIVAILAFTSSGPRLDASARLDQVTIQYPSNWTFSNDTKTIYVDNSNAEGGMIVCSTAGDFVGSEGIDQFVSHLADTADFRGSPTDFTIDGAAARRQAVAVDNMTGEVLFVATDEGTTCLFAVMPSSDNELQKTIGPILDSAVLSPGKKCTITLKSDGDTTDSFDVYDYGNGVTCTINVDGSNNDKETPTSGRVLTGWEADDPEVKAVLNNEGKWEVAGVSKDVALNAIWTDAHKVTFTDGEGNEIAVVGVLDGKPATAPDEPSREGFAFDGWDADFSKVNNDMTVNAKWAEAHTVTFTDGMGNTLASVAVKDGESAKAPSDPTRGGYTFGGWDADFSKVTGDIRVNAKWDSEFKATLRGFGDFEQTTVSGTGDDVIDIPCAGKPCIMIINNDGSRNFVVRTLDSSGDAVDLLVNTIGPYSGTVTTYLDFNKAQLVEVKSSGSWSITFAPMADMPDAGSGSSFDGDNVVAISEESLSKVHITNSGPRNFVVRGIGRNSAKLLVNDIGDYDGTVAWGEPQCFFIVRSSGTWSISW